MNKKALPPELDKECEKLFLVLNSLPGIKTVESCCGHDKDNFSFWFHASNLRSKGLAILARATCPRYGLFEWKIEIYHGDSPLVYFELVGPVDKNSGDNLADEINKWLKHNGFMSLVNEWARRSKRLLFHGVLCK